MDSKQLLVLSDTHGHIPALTTVLNWAKDRSPPNGTICVAAFLGDGLSDIRPAVDATGFLCDWKLINGNNDFGFSLPESSVFDFEEHRFFICHGHRYTLYGGYNALVAAARNEGADVALSGHSHVPYKKTVSGIQLINPGSVGRPRSKIGATFAVIECPPDKPVKVKFWGINSRGYIRETMVEN
ncbi:MAG: YfcE family phosphodiesterase [Treponema sp.]|jgi:putative phosphoesterase|nr:YfcE family phosphodiesterase [Treponema sp.]